MSADEVRAVVGSGRRVSALLADAGAPRVDRELIHALRAAGAATIVATDGKVQRDWDSLGAAAVLGPGFDVAQLLDALGRHAELVVDDLRVPAQAELVGPDHDQATLIAVTGTGGAGSSTIAMSVAQALARVAAGRPAPRVALVDGVRRGDLAMYHDVGDVIPGLPELVDAHRVDTVDPDEVRRLLFHVVDRSYDVLLGLRRPRDWVSLRPRSVDAALDGLRRAYDAVVVDVDADLEGEHDTGSVDVEDRHCVTRCSLARRRPGDWSSGAAGLKGLHDLVRLSDDVALSGVPAAAHPARPQPVDQEPGGQGVDLAVAHPAHPRRHRRPTRGAPGCDSPTRACAPPGRDVFPTRCADHSDVPCGRCCSTPVPGSSRRDDDAPVAPGALGVPDDVVVPDHRDVA